ncbi:MAG: hypothetical protein VXZ82_01955 [Planctomycetota bacterium]|nr:hypothetical protein [Planctomycetota bacterium]
MRLLLIALIIFNLASISPAQDTDAKKGKRKLDRKAFLLMSGIYETVSWNDGSDVHKPPAISGRWAFVDGKTMCIIHNRVDSKQMTSLVGWGYGYFKDGKFHYTYPEFTTIKGDASQSTLQQGGPFEGERVYDIRFEGDSMVMTSESGKQVWEVTPEGMRYTDQESGKDKVYAQRVWKRLSNKVPN